MSEEQKTPVGVPYSTSIGDLDLSVQAYNCLKAAGYLTVGDLVELKIADLLKWRSFGRKTLMELEAMLEGNGLELK